MEMSELGFPPLLSSPAGFAFVEKCNTLLCCVLFSYADIMLSLTRKGFHYLLAVLCYDPTKHAGKVSFVFLFLRCCLISGI